MTHFMRLALCMAASVHVDGAAPVALSCLMCISRETVARVDQPVSAVSLVNALIFVNFVVLVTSAILCVYFTEFAHESALTLANAKQGNKQKRRQPDSDMPIYNFRIDSGQETCRNSTTALGRTVDLATGQASQNSQNTCDTFDLW